MNLDGDYSGILIAKGEDMVAFAQPSPGERCMFVFQFSGGWPSLAWLRRL
jgi:hypothetical protein